MTTAQLLIAHGATALVALVALAMNKAWHTASAIAVAVATDVVFLHGGASWQAETALAFAGPCAVLLAAASTVGARVPLAVAIEIPLIVIAAAGVARGEVLGVHGVAVSLAATNIYAVFVGAVLLRVGARQVERFAAGACGLVLATCAPAIVGWVYLASGDSVRSAAVVDLLFFSAIVVTSYAQWTRRCTKQSLHSSQARLPGR